MLQVATAKIHLNHLYKNLQYLLNLNNQQPLFVILKSDAYGHGLQRVATGIDDNFNQLVNFAVSDTNSALFLKQQTARRQVLHLHGFTDKQELETLKQNGVLCMLHSDHQIALLQTCKNEDSPILGVWLKVNTRMNRLGFKDLHQIKQQWQVLQDLESKGRVWVHGVASHFACADEPSSEQNTAQLTAFKQFIQTLNAIAPVKNISLSNSAALLQNLVTANETARPGIGLYGVSPLASSITANTMPKAAQQLLPVMKLTAPIIAKQFLEKGDCVGYGSIWRASKKSQIALVKIGYGDGYPRQIAPKTMVWIYDDFYPIVGRVSMNLLTVDISQNTDDKRPIEVGNWVELWGEKQLVSTTANQAKMIAYELLCQIGHRRIQRVYE